MDLVGQSEVVVFDIDVVPNIFKVLALDGASLPVWPGIRAEVIEHAKRLGVVPSTPVPAPASSSLKREAVAEVKVKPCAKAIAPKQNRRTKRRQFMNCEKQQRIVDPAQVRKMPRELLEKLVVSLKSTIRSMRHKQTLIVNFNSLNRQKKSRRLKKFKKMTQLLFPYKL